MGNGGCFSFKLFEFRSGVTNNGNLLSLWPKYSQGMAVFDFEIGVATSVLLDVVVGVGLFGEKGLFKQIEVGL